MSKSLSLPPYFISFSSILIYLLLIAFPSPLGPREEFQWSWSCTSSHQDVSECRQYRGQNAVIDFTFFEVLFFAFFLNVLEIFDNFLLTDFAFVLVL